MRCETRVIVTSVLLVVVNGLVARAGQESDSPARNINEELLAALDDQPLPSMVIHHLVFGRAIELDNVQAINEDAIGIDASVLLEIVGPGMIVPRASEPKHVNTGDAVVVGDVIIGGVIQNVSDGVAAVLSFANEGTMTLGPGEGLYIGSEKRLIAQESEVSLAVAALRPAQLVCACKCDPEGPEDPCSLELPAELTTECSAMNGILCGCGSPFDGALDNCKLMVQPIKQLRDAQVWPLGDDQTP